MQCNAVLDFFLGALSPSGFTGWFAEAAATPGITPYLIKAGPGCGKSTLMRHLAEADAARGQRSGSVIERIHCSSDPASLDGVLLGDVSALVLDSTAPHTLDCKYPDAAERVLSFYDTLDHNFLRAHRNEILLLGARNTALLQQAAAHFALACALLQRRRVSAAAALDHEKLCRFGKGLAQRTMPKRQVCTPGRQSHRLLSAPTPGGITFYRQSIPQLAPEAVYAIHDGYGAASAALLAQLAAHAQHNGYDAILCPCPTDQRGKLDHLFIPALGLGFVTVNEWHSLALPGQHNIFTSRFLDAKALAAGQKTLRYQKRLAVDLLGKTCATQTDAKTVHDALEKYYVQATDFSAVDAIRQKLEQELFSV